MGDRAWLLYYCNEILIVYIEIPYFKYILKVSVIKIKHIFFLVHLFPNFDINVYDLKKTPNTADF